MRTNAEVITNSNLDAEISAALYLTRALRFILFDLKGKGLDWEARRAAAELAFTVEMKIEEARESYDTLERLRIPAADASPMEAGRA